MTVDKKSQPKFEIPPKAGKEDTKETSDRHKALELALAQAKSGLIIANANYSRTVEGARDGDIAAAQAALNAAYANYNRLRKGADPSDVTGAEAAVSKAEADLRAAQRAYDVAFKMKPSAIGDSPTVAQLEQAKNNLRAAQLQLEKVRQGADNAQVAGGVQQIEDAKARLEKLQSPAQDYDVRRAEAERKRAELAVERAQRQLDKASLLAPVDGVVSNIAIEVCPLNKREGSADLLLSSGAFEE